VWGTVPLGLPGQRLPCSLGWLSLPTAPLDLLSNDNMRDAWLMEMCGYYVQSEL
jgi:hypothetical protein